MESKKFTQEEIQMLVDFGIRNTDSKNPLQLLEVKEQVEGFIFTQTNQYVDFLKKGNNDNDFVISEMPLIYEALRQSELRSTKNKMEELQDILEIIEDPEGFEESLNLMEE